MRLDSLQAYEARLKVLSSSSSSSSSPLWSHCRFLHCLFMYTSSMVLSILMCVECIDRIYFCTHLFHPSHNTPHIFTHRPAFYPLTFIHCLLTFTSIKSAGGAGDVGVGAALLMGPDDGIFVGNHTSPLAFSSPSPPFIFSSTHSPTLARRLSPHPPSHLSR